MNRSKAWVIRKTKTGQTLTFRDLDAADLDGGRRHSPDHPPDGDLQDGLAMTGRSPVVRRFPMIPGIDFSGIVETSDYPGHALGDAVILTGWDVG